MSDSMLPLVREMHDAADDRSRADILLRVPDTILLKYAEIFEKCCRKTDFQPGLDFILLRIVAMGAVRTEAGHLPPEQIAHLESYRSALALYACGEAGPAEVST